MDRHAFWTRLLRAVMLLISWIVMLLGHCYGIIMLFVSRHACWCFQTDRHAFGTRIPRSSCNEADTTGRTINTSQTSRHVYLGHPPQDLMRSVRHAYLGHDPSCFSERFMLVHLSRVIWDTVCPHASYNTFRTHGWHD